MPLRRGMAMPTGRRLSPCPGPQPRLPTLRVMREVRIRKRREVHAFRCSQLKAKASGMAQALLENMGSIMFIEEGAQEANPSSRSKPNPVGP